MSRHCQLRLNPHHVVDTKDCIRGFSGGLFSMQHRVMFIVACSAGVLGGTVRVAMSFSWTVSTQSLLPNKLVSFVYVIVAFTSSGVNGG